MQENLSGTLSLKLQKDILKGVYPIGSKIPSERELAVSYGVSRITVRDAVRKLTQLGLLKKMPKSGTYVNDYRSETSISLLLSIVQSTSHIDADILESLLEIRKVMEVHLAGKAALLSDADSVNRLKELVREMESSVDDRQALSDADIRVHEHIIACADNILAKLVFNSIRSLYKYYVDFFYTIEGSAAIVGRYKKLLSAITRGDREGASSAMEKILSFAETRVMAALLPATKGTAIDITKMVDRG
jgi:GntR family transcriptional repressor for pyruvate dehydrogenase complex